MVAERAKTANWESMLARGVLTAMAVWKVFTEDVGYLLTQDESKIYSMKSTSDTERT